MVVVGCGELRRGGGSNGEATPSLNPLAAVDLKLKESLLARRLFLVLRSVANFKLQGKDDFSRSVREVGVVVAVELCVSVVGGQGWS